MTMPWMRSSDGARNAGSGEDELGMIPNWSIVLAIVVFGAIQYLFNGVLPHRHHEMLPMRLLMGYSWGTAFATYVLLVGYVSRDEASPDAGGIVDADCGGDAGRHWGCGVFPAASAAALSVPALQYRACVECSFLSAVPVSISPGVWTVLPWRGDYRCVLRQLRSRSCGGPGSVAAARVQRLGLYAADRFNRG